MDDPLRKPAPTPLCRPQCCSMQSFKRAGVLLVFHLLNVLVAIGGVITVVLLLTRMALMPIWLIAVLVIVLVASVLNAVQHIEKKCLMYCAYDVLVALYLASQSINWYIMVGPYAVIVAGVLGVGLFFVSAASVKFLVEIDVIFVNFVTTDNSNIRDPDDYQDHFELSETTDDSYVLPHIRMTRHVWLAVIYFALFKLVIGVLSTAVLVVSVVLPALVVFSGGDVSAFGGQVTFSDNPIVYTVLVFTVWLVGVVGALVVAVLSVKVTLWVCDVGQRQTEVEVESAISVTPTPELTTSNFAEINPSTPVASSGAAAVV